MSRDTAGGPIWARPEPRGRGPRFSRAQIADAALAIADADGIDAVSMRNVATRLGAGTMTLYNYVRTKDELVALMDDALMAEVLVPARELPGDWREAVATIARRTWAVLLRHPWAVATGRGGASLGPNAMRHFEQYLAVLAGTGLDSAATFDLLAVVDSYVFGSVLRAGESRRSATGQDPETVAAIIDYGLAQLRTGEFPHTAALLGDRDPRDPDAPRPPIDEQGLVDQFERGLQAILDGAAARFVTPGMPNDASAR
ncbi:TetR family transcriptional regulator [Asanoa ferruginea]|nr:TetR/AcrR family transcriptional regulator C-terminal domain-containing protein [Asanoa ferruginea]GIF48592.1 TetR family transcriptional regulator [Asanoa ferruginea]